MTLDYSSHPADLVEGGVSVLLTVSCFIANSPQEVQGVKKTVTVDDLKKAIPAHCFKPSYSKAFFYLFRDFLVVGALGAFAWICIPQLNYRVARYAAWLLYGYFQGLAFTGLWVSVLTTRYLIMWLMRITGPGA